MAAERIEATHTVNQTVGTADGKRLLAGSAQASPVVVLGAANVSLAATINASRDWARTVGGLLLVLCRK